MLLASVRLINENAHFKHLLKTHFFQLRLRHLVTLCFLVLCINILTHSLTIRMHNKKDTHQKTQNTDRNNYHCSLDTHIAYLGVSRWAAIAVVVDVGVHWCKHKVANGTWLIVILVSYIHGSSQTLSIHWRICITHR